MQADRNNNCIRSVDVATGYTKTLAGNYSLRDWGYADGIGQAALFAWPQGVAMDANATFALVAVSDSNTFCYEWLGPALPILSPRGTYSAGYVQSLRAPHKYFHGQCH